MWGMRPKKRWKSNNFLYLNIFVIYRLHTLAMPLLQSYLHIPCLHFFCLSLPWLLYTVCHGYCIQFAMAIVYSLPWLLYTVCHGYCIQFAMAIVYSPILIRAFCIILKLKCLCERHTACFASAGTVV